MKDKRPPDSVVEKDQTQSVLVRVIDFMWQSDKSSYEHVWPVSLSNISACH